MGSVSIRIARRFDIRMRLRSLYGVSYGRRLICYIELWQMATR